MYVAFDDMKTQSFEWIGWCPVTDDEQRCVIGQNMETVQ